MISRYTFARFFGGGGKYLSVNGPSVFPIFVLGCWHLMKLSYNSLVMMMIFMEFGGILGLCFS